MAAQLVSNLAEPFQPEKYTDDYRASLMKIIRAKMKGQKVEMPERDEPESTNVLDLMSRLQASLEQSGSKKAPRGTRAPRKSADGGSRSKRRRTA